MLNVRRRYSVRTLCTAVALALLWPSGAKAQIIPDSAYNDAKSVIADLMEDDVAKNVVPNMACQAPLLLVYYPESLQRIYDRQFSSLKSGLKNETATLLGSFVWWWLAAGGKGDLRDFLQRSLVIPNPLTCPQAVREGGGPAYYTTNRETLLEHNCRSNATPTAECQLSLAARDYLLGQEDTGEAHLQRLLGVLLADSYKLHEAAEVEDFLALVAAFVKDPTLAVASLPATTANVAAVLAQPAFVEGLRALGREWQLTSCAGKRKITPTDVIDIFLSSAVPFLKTRCDASTSCGALLPLFQSTSEARDLLIAAANHDARAVAVDALRAAFVETLSQRECNAKPVAAKVSELVPRSDAEVKCDAAARISVYGRFAATLAAYVLDSESSTVSDATSAAFRSAAFDLLRTDGPNSGFNRDNSSIYWPKPALRVSWSPGYINEVSHDGFRYVASLDWLTTRLRFRYTSSSYLAAYLSLIDFLGPLSESALRQQDPTPNKSSRVWRTFLTPRAEFVVGFPGLSTHLALVAGASYRTAAAFHDPGDTKSFTYYSWLSPSDKPSTVSGNYAFYSQFIETSLGFKYVP